MPQQEIKAKVSMFMTAFDLDYLSNKYNAEKNPTMKDATKDYQ